jgi:hypothetical protein
LPAQDDAPSEPIDTSPQFIAPTIDIAPIVPAPQITTTEAEKAKCEAAGGVWAKHRTPAGIKWCRGYQIGELERAKAECAAKGGTPKYIPADVGQGFLCEPKKAAPTGDRLIMPGLPGLDIPTTILEDKEEKEPPPVDVPDDDVEAPGWTPRNFMAACQQQGRNYNPATGACEMQLPTGQWVCVSLVGASPQQTPGQCKKGLAANLPLIAGAGLAAILLAKMV